eukprot:TRINITY_DN2384_c0_g1_i1.p1 TRINITY_DN2384_c0_g1~~TRINITY_DN2384_c0_g1_i1.p1  ORF type:complete len:498 (-),score=24.23 TRINITY_DN2384_c0_g1_i1:94-1425(-)
MMKGVQSIGRTQKAQPTGSFAHPPLATSSPALANFVDFVEEHTPLSSPLSAQQPASAGDRNKSWTAAAANLFTRSPVSPTPVQPHNHHHHVESLSGAGSPAGDGSTLPPKHIYIVQGPDGTTVAYSQNGAEASPIATSARGAPGQGQQHYIYIVPTLGNTPGQVAVVAPSGNPVTQTTEPGPAQGSASATGSVVSSTSPSPAPVQNSEESAEPPKPMGIHTVEEVFGPPPRSTPAPSPHVKRTSWGGGSGMPPPNGLARYSAAPSPTRSPAKSPGSPALRRRSLSRNTATPTRAPPPPASPLPPSQRIPAEVYIPLPGRTGRSSADNMVVLRGAGSAARRSSSTGAIGAARSAPVFFPLPRRSAAQRSHSAPILSPLPEKARRHSYTAGTQSFLQRVAASPRAPASPSSNPPALPGRPSTVSPLRSRICFKPTKPAGKKRPWL